MLGVVFAHYVKHPIGDSGLLCLFQLFVWNLGDYLFMFFSGRFFFLVSTNDNRLLR